MKTQLRFIFLVLFSFLCNSIIGQDTIQQKIDYYISQSKLDSAKLYINKNLVRLKNVERKNALNYQLVKVLFMQSAYDESLDQAYNSLDAIDDEQQRIKFNFMIGVIYSAIADYGKSVDYFDLVVEHDQNSSLSLQTHLLLSQLHIDSGDSLNAGKSLTKAYELSKTIEIDDKTKKHVAMQYNFYHNNYEECKKINFDVLKDTTSFFGSKTLAYQMIGDCLSKQDSLLKASEYYDELLKYTVESKDPEQIKVAANKLIAIHEKLGNQEKANAFHKIYNEAVNDSLSFTVEKYRGLYNIEKNRELSIAKSKALKRNLLLGVLFLILVATGAYFLIKSKRKYNDTFNSLVKIPGKKIIINDVEIEKITTGIQQLKKEQLYLTPNITRKSFCNNNQITSERYLSQYINDNYKNSFSVFINDLRIEYAHNRMQTDSKFRNYKIEEIAKACGFGSKKSFERAFIAKYKETPYKFILSITN
jgi:AraC-like DNA-binding protein